jgi:hypothetical protein
MSIILQSSGGGSVTIAEPATASNFTQTLPAAGGTILTTLAPKTGNVLQVVQTVKTNTFSTTSATLVDITGLSVTITPTSSSNIIMVLATVTGGSTDAVGIGTTFQLVRNSTNIATSTTTGGSTTGTFSFAQRSMGTQNMQTSGVNFIDSPATTSATTYKLQCLTQAGTLYVNQDGGGSCTGISSITVMEIAG